MTRTQKKFLIFLAGTLALWRMAELPVVQNAFLQFLAVGQVPGTDVFLSPKAVFILLAAIFATSLILIFRKELVGSISRSRRVVAGTASRDSAAIPVKRSEKGIVISRPRRIAGVNIPEGKLNLKDKIFPALYVPPLRPAIWRLMDWEMRMLSIGYRHIKVVSVVVWFQVLRGWRRLEPHIRRLDKIIEKRVRKNHVVSELIEIAEECWRVVAASRRKTEKS